MTAETPRIVADIMTRKLATAYEEENLVQILAAMERLHFRHLPVIDDGKLVGLVTHRDLLRLSASSMDPVAGVRDATAQGSIFIRDVMQTEVTTVAADTPLAEAARLMRDTKLGCLPVVDAESKLVGMVTASDFLGLVLTLLGSD